MNISVIGLGKLGAVMAALFADRGHNITGVDKNRAFIDAVNEGRAPVQEPGLPELIGKNRERLRATLDTEGAVLASDATFIIVPTPSGPDGKFSLDYVRPAVESIGNALKRKSGYHLVVLSSTVMPGDTAGEVQPLLEATSGKRCGADFGLCYNPEFIALGSVIRDMSRPDMVLIGECDERAGAMLAGIYQHVCESDYKTARMNFVNAELTKLSVNTYVTTKISYANMLADLCERLPGADVDTVTQALGLDKRIGPKYLKGALGYGGPCFPRDNVAFSALARSLGMEAILADATQRINHLQVPRLTSLITSLLPDGGAVGILGLAYKPATNVIEESQGMLLAESLLKAGVPLVVYDPLAMDNAKAILGARIRYTSSVQECAAAAHLIVIMNPAEEFRALRPEHLNAERGTPAVVDCWRILPRQEFESAANYVTLGQASAPSARSFQA
ncbi:MAG: UDP-glucose/GDP-mannose dehydrogenase family protein [Acidimicrobiia bacterium]|nr:UDP-glucose/GDP-mannose dehydrogenase family protein [Acidimicrobiia bacterium]